MIAEIIKEAYDISGKKVSKPTGKRIRVFHPTFPMGRFLSHPLSKQFTSIHELRIFLCNCRYVSDQEQFGKRDYWLPPEKFEQCRQGDCEDFALYAWRQLIDMGIKSRFVVGQSGLYGYGHAWVTMEQNEKSFIIEPLACRHKKIPRLSTVRYKPEISVEQNDGKISYFSHSRRNYNPPIADAIILFKEWLGFWIKNRTINCTLWILSPITFLISFLYRFKKAKIRVESDE